ncbi:flavin reductase family protein, partial [Streptomyces scabiei]|uniref:flavin reductase family protein n=1 Tax=Streptomyces scabiei TaxID=1930 RepID=UPI0029B00314
PPPSPPPVAWVREFVKRQSPGHPPPSGAPAWIDCVIHAVHTGGDHLIVVGRVEALDTDDGTPPLLFHRGRFGQLRT